MVSGGCHRIERQVHGGLAPERDDSFTIALDGPVHPVLGVGKGLGTIAIDVKGEMRRLVCAVALLVSVPSLAAANSYCVDRSDYFELGDTGETFPECTTLKRCRPPELTNVIWELVNPDCEPMTGLCAVKVKVSSEFPGNHQNDPGQSGFAYSFASVALKNSAGTAIDTCGYGGAVIQDDLGRFERTESVSCALSRENPNAYKYTLEATMCPCAPGQPFCPWESCQKKTTIELDFAANDALDCVPKCRDGCPVRKGVGSGGAGIASGVATNADPSAGDGAHFRYRSGGVGNPNLPGTSTWKTTYGRNWSHDYAERIALDPDRPLRAYLITADAVFREFRDTDNDGLYDYASPSDEKRKLSKIPGGGWRLEGLDGTVTTFAATGLWQSTLDPNGVGKTATYAGSNLTRVEMPDGQHETFSYDGAGRIAAMAKVGIDNTTSRSWSFVWSGDDLARIDLPDGRKLKYLYEDPRHPGFMTQSILVGTNGSERIETAWQYDVAGRVSKIWKGSVTAGTNGPTPGPGAVELWSFRILGKNGAGLVTRAEVTDPMGGVSIQDVSHDPRSETPRLTKSTGDCPTCGLGPNSELTYGDPANPMLPTESVDARGTRTVVSYDANGMVVERIEALGTPLERATSYEHAGPFAALTTAVEQPSTAGNSARRTETVYDGAGNATSRTISGIEAGSAFDFTTVTVPTAQGVPQSIDPPGNGTADVTSFSYDPARGGLVPLTRTDPLVGTTTFGYDALNRRTSVTDPNGIETVTSYDLGHRVTEVRQKGATAADDLVTTYQYTPFGELLRTTLPEGNVIENVYDAAGRLTEIHRKPNAATLGERTLFTLDNLGHRVREDRQRWDGAQWVSDSFESFVYSSRCHLEKVVHADGSVTEYGYDCEGNLERVWDANHPSNNKTNPASQVYSYDPLDRMATMSQPWAGAGGGNAVTTYGYDVQDHLTSVVDAEGNETIYAYSDRDLMTNQDSEVSGATSYRYDEHGELTQETDARGVTVIRTLDVLDRVVEVDYPENALDTIYVYDEAAVPFSKGRLTRIERPGSAIDYRYDRFGRMTQDGQLGYAFTRNGNRSKATYPGSLEVTYGFDFADRETSLTLSEPGVGSTTIASNARYLASGPLTELELGNGVTESRQFDTRFFPSRIRATKGAATLLDWQYSTDDVGNPTAIADGASPSGSKSYGYLDFAYFLTSGSGPWGSQAWTYDKIGNRLSETDDGVTETYRYPANDAGGRNPKLAEVTPPAPDPSTRFYFDDAGDQIYEVEGNTKQALDYDADKRLSQLVIDSPEHPTHRSTMTYDGRGFLTRSELSPAPGQPWQRFTEAVYSSAGVLQQKRSVSRIGINTLRNTPTVDETATILYFAGRPIAILERGSSTPFGGGASTSSRSLTYLTTDHLGTPALATDSSGASSWAGGFEPFGEDFSGADSAGVFLRFPGQWNDSTWEGSGLYQNVHRWFSPKAGRYAIADPVSDPLQPRSPYGYALTNPLSVSDSLGLFAVSKNYDVKKMTPENLIAVCGVTGGACTLAYRASLAFDCVEICSEFYPVNVTLHIAATIRFTDPIIYRAKTGLKANDPTVKDAESARAHEEREHLDPSIAQIAPIIRGFQSQRFSSEQDCIRTGSGISNDVSRGFREHMVFTQNEEQKKYERK